MRMWLVDPKIMCRQHLLGEHVELHMFVGTIQKGISLAGYLRDQLLEPQSLKCRHLELIAEMEARGYNHKSPLPEIELKELAPGVWEIDRAKSQAELLRRCPACLARFEMQNLKEARLGISKTG